jgi:hypothetical protein
MVLISLRPFVPRRILVLAAAIIGLCAVSCFANPLLFAVDNTPYDRQMARIRSILATSALRPEQNLSLELVNHWIEDLRGIPYGFSTEWKTPTEVARDAVADCKGKAVTLYERMREHGARNLRLVIGKRAPSSRVTHTWVEWSTESRTYVLDPAINWSASPLTQIPTSFYISYYAFSGTRKYCAAASPGLLAKL